MTYFLQALTAASSNCTLPLDYDTMVKPQDKLSYNFLFTEVIQSHVLFWIKSSDLNLCVWLSVEVVKMSAIYDQS